MRYTVLEISTAVKPWLLAHMLADGRPAITYLDPDIRIYSSLEPLHELACRHGVVLTPHNVEPLPDDGERPGQVDILLAGVYNLGYVSLGAGQETETLLRWWRERLLHDCRVDPLNGYFVDQRWFDLAPGLVSDRAIVREPQYNLAYWNLHGHDLKWSGSGYTVDGVPLAFYHFSGFHPEQPDVLSRHQTRVLIEPGSALERICNQYAQELADAGYRGQQGLALHVRGPSVGRAAEQDDAQPLHHRRRGGRRLGVDLHPRGGARVRALAIRSGARGPGARGPRTGRGIPDPPRSAGGLQRSRRRPVRTAALGARVRRRRGAAARAGRARRAGGRAAHARPGRRRRRGPGRRERAAGAGARVGRERRRLLPLGARDRGGRTPGGQRARRRRRAAAAGARADDPAEPPGSRVRPARLHGGEVPGQPDLHERRRARRVRGAGGPGVLQRQVLDRHVVLGGRAFPGAVAAVLRPPRRAVAAHRSHRAGARAAVHGPDHQDHPPGRDGPDPAGDPR